MSNYIDKHKFAEYFNSVLTHLAQNNDNETDFDALLKSLGIPDSYHSVLWNNFWNVNPRLVDANPGLKRRATINEYGLKRLADDKKNKEKAERQEQTENQQSEKLMLEIEKLRNEFFDYPEVKNRAKWAIRLSVLTLIVTILLGLLRLKCKVPD